MVTNILIIILCITLVFGFLILGRRLYKKDDKNPFAWLSFLATIIFGAFSVIGLVNFYSSSNANGNGTAYISTAQNVYTETNQTPDTPVSPEPSPTPEPLPTSPPEVNIAVVDGDNYIFLGRDILAYQSSNVAEFPASGSFRMAGVYYTKGLTMNNNANALFNIDGQFTTLSGLYGSIDGTYTNRTIRIFGDGRLIVDLHSYGLAMPRPFSIDITGVTQLRIEHSGGSQRHALANLILSNDPIALPEIPSADIRVGSAFLGSDIRAYQSSNVTEFPAGGSFRMAGINFVDGLTMNNNANALFNIGGRFTTLSGLYGSIDGTYTNRTIRIFGDGRLIVDLHSYGLAMPRPFSIDITGVNQLRIEHSGGSQRHALANLILSNDPIVLPEMPSAGIYTDSAFLGSDIRAYQSSNVTEFPAGGSFRMAGINFVDGLTMNNNANALFNIDGQFTTLSGLYGSIDGTYTNRTIRIFGDGRLLVDLHSYGLAMPRPFSIDITGVTQLRIEHSGGSQRHALANLVVSNDPIILPEIPNIGFIANNAALGSDIRAYQSSNVTEFPAGGSFRMAGVNIVDGLTMNNNANALFNIGGHFTSLSGTYGPVDETTTNRTIRIYGDGRLLVELHSYGGAMPQPFDIDITGIIQLRITHSGGSQRHALANVILSK